MPAQCRQTRSSPEEGLRDPWKRPDPGECRWDLVIAIFAQPPAPIRRRLYAAMARALRAEGRFVLETKVQADAGADECHPGVEILGRELSPLRLDIARESERPIAEGRYHSGSTRTAQILACKVA